MYENKMSLDDLTYERIKALSKRGDDLVNSGEYEKAIVHYENAMTLIPEPVIDWDAATWLLTAIGEAWFFADNHQKAYKALARAMHCPGAIGNPFIHMRLGQVQLELGNDILAADELTRAYMGGGKEIFETELPKYFKFLKTRIAEPPEGW